MVVFGQQLLYSIESGCIPAKVVVYGETWLYLGKRVCIEQSGYIWAKVVIFGQELLYSGEVVAFGQKLFYSGKSGCIRAKLVVFVKVV